MIKQNINKHLFVGRKKSGTALKYLYEFTAIPQNVRERFLAMLLKRKNAGMQKNVRLLKIIYTHIEEDSMLEWDEEKICAALSVSKSMLYCHKSWLLKNIRKMYFGWDEKQSRADKHGSTEHNLAVAKKMLEIGMRREAKNILTKLERKLNKKKRQSLKDKTALFYICRYLCQYYYSLKAEKQFRKYFKLVLKYFSFLRVRAKAGSYELSPDIMVHYYFCRSYKATYNIKKMEELTTGRKYLEEALCENEKIHTQGNDLLSQMINTRSELLMNIANIYSSEPGGFEKAEKYAELGAKNAMDAGLEGDLCCFRILQTFLEFIQKKTAIEECIKRLNYYFEKTEHIRLKTSFKRIILTKAVFLSSSYRDSSLLFSYFSRLNSFEILNYGFNSSFRTLYSARFKLYTDKILSMKYNERGILEAGGMHPYYYSKMTGAIEEVMLNFCKIPDLYFIKEVYLYMLITELCKGKNYDADYCHNIIKKVEWLNKSRGKPIAEANKIAFELARFFARMLKDMEFRSKPEIIDRYIGEFKQRAEKFAEHPAGTHYGLFSLVAGETGCGEFTEVVNELYFNLDKKYPAFFEYYKTPGAAAGITV